MSRAKTLQSDVAVIGAGSAGLNARREAEIQGARALMIESGPYGTTCARVGCMPSKLLIAAADHAHESASADSFGIRVPEVRVDGVAVLERVRRERDRFVGFVVDDVEALDPGLRLRGSARFVDPNRLELDDGTRIDAKAIVVATGSSPQIPDSLAGVQGRVLTTDSIFELADLPESVAVLGTGIIGLELGQALHRLGVRVSLFARSGRLGPLSDPGLQQAASEVFASELDIRLASALEARPAGDSGLALRWTESGQSHQANFEYVLAAAGRRPNLEKLELGRAGVALGPNGIPRFDPLTGQLGSAPIFIAGDVTGERALLHEASDEGRIAGYNAAHFPDVRAHRRRTGLKIAFTDPQIAVVGRAFSELDPDRAESGRVDFADQGRARVMGKNSGEVRVYADRHDGRLLGAEMLGPRVENMAHLLAWAVQSGMTVQEALQMPFYHPVLEEGLRTALRDLARKLRFERAPCARDLDCGPGA